MGGRNVDPEAVRAAMAVDASSRSNARERDFSGGSGGSGGGGSGGSGGAACVNEGDTGGGKPGTAGRGEDGGVHAPRQYKGKHWSSAAAACVLSGQPPSPKAAAAVAARAADAGSGGGGHSRKNGSGVGGSDAGIFIVPYNGRTAPVIAESITGDGDDGVDGRTTGVAGAEKGVAGGAAATATDAATAAPAEEERKGPRPRSVWERGGAAPAPKTVWKQLIARNSHVGTRSSRWNRGTGNSGGVQGRGPGGGCGEWKMPGRVSEVQRWGGGCEDVSFCCLTGTLSIENIQCCSSAPLPHATRPSCVSFFFSTTARPHPCNFPTPHIAPFSVPPNSVTVKVGDLSACIKRCGGCLSCCSRSGDGGGSGRNGGGGGVPTDTNRGRRRPRNPPPSSRNGLNGEAPSSGGSGIKAAGVFLGVGLVLEVVATLWAFRVAAQAGALSGGAVDGTAGLAVTALAVALTGQAVEAAVGVACLKAPPRSGGGGGGALLAGAATFQALGVVAVAAVLTWFLPGFTGDDNTTTADTNATQGTWPVWAAAAIAAAGALLEAIPAGFDPAAKKLPFLGAFGHALLWLGVAALEVLVALLLVREGGEGSAAGQRETLAGIVADGEVVGLMAVEAVAMLAVWAARGLWTRARLLLAVKGQEGPSRRRSAVFTRADSV